MLRDVVETGAFVLILVMGSIVAGFAIVYVCAVVVRGFQDILDRIRPAPKDDKGTDKSVPRTEKRPEPPLPIRSIHFQQGRIWAVLEVPAVEFPEACQYAIEEMGLEPDEAMLLPAHMLHGEWIMMYPDGSGTVKKILAKLQGEEHE